MTKASFSDLKNKTVIIAGATGLIGRELCKGFVEQESIVILASKNKVKGKGQVISNKIISAFCPPLEGD